VGRAHVVGPAEQVKVAIQGERGSFSDVAARKLLRDEVYTLSCTTFDEVFASVTSGAASAAVIPIENTLAGSIHRNCELLGTSDLQIAGEVLLRIEHHLIVRPGTPRERVKRILSHPVALAQCQRFLASMHVEAVAADDTAGSVKLMIEGESEDVAAIAGARAAELYGAEILVRNVEDHPENYTRFLLVAPVVLSRADGEGSQPRRSSHFEILRFAQDDGGAEAMKTSILFRTPNTAGSLWRALAAFALRDINLMKLESRPIEGRPWEYSFYVDIAGGVDEPVVANALSHLREMCETVKILGSYAAASE
jgi:prephenate dehydratase